MIIVWIRLVAVKVVRSGRACTCFESVYCEGFADEFTCVMGQMWRLTEQSRILVGPNEGIEGSAAVGRLWE